MPRNISFALTTQQIKDRTKTVTRRTGWKFLKGGEILQGCVKCMGLKAGEKVEKLALIRVVSARREPLRAMTENPRYGFEETTLEGFPPGHELNYPTNFVNMLCESQAKVTPDIEVTRIEFEYITPIQGDQLEIEPVEETEIIEVENV